jgi:hypothetical protein
MPSNICKNTASLQPAVSRTVNIHTANSNCQLQIDSQYVQCPAVVLQLQRFSFVHYHTVFLMSHNDSELLSFPAFYRHPDKMTVAASHSRWTDPEALTF